MDVNLSSVEIYDKWFDLYKLLSTMPLDDSNFRELPLTIQTLREAGWGVDFEILENYWRRVEWVANSCNGRVLEVGAGMGNITKYIARNPTVDSVVAVDLLPRYIDVLKTFELKKVHAYCIDINKNQKELSLKIPFDCVVLSEVIEHISSKEEIALNKTINKLVAFPVTWVLTTPINYMSDPDHVRGFRTWHFKLRSKLLYGKITSYSHNTIQQFVKCRYEKRGFILYKTCEISVRMLDFFFEIRPSGHPWKYLSIFYKRLKLILRYIKL